MQMSVLYYVEMGSGSPLFDLCIMAGSVQRVLGIGLGLVEASETRSLDEAESMFFSSLLESLYY